ncbi:basal body-orientation factor 1 isoform X3 [Hemicordylus capensis]|uniref:basal body-orientation factor 1 isoform X3 n=1 Tax=Hemicordylus capensis TaxID=884348 RepID=UPI002302A28F|nr:basal body-orientation factor 1 isoform X3 [Hemicordylus capensis]
MKGKAKGKAAKGGRAKTGGGAGRGNKADSKALKEETEAERAKAAAALWEARLEVTEISRKEYREAARRLARNNEELERQQRRLEKDSVEVISLLKKQDLEKEELIEKLKQQVNELKQQAKAESEKVIKENMETTKKEHQETICMLERKFLEEKQRLEREAEKKIVMLAERAHHEAILQLDNTGRSVFTENVRLHEALGYHMKEIEELQKLKQKLEEDNAFLSQEKETNEILVREKILQITRQKTLIQELQDRVRKLEDALNLLAREFKTEIQSTQKRALVQNQAGQIEIEKLQQVLEMKDREMSRVKKLARNILDERTEVEKFFLDALEQVKEEIMTSRKCYKQVAQAAYQRKMMSAFAGKEEYPQIRTFNDNMHSTNSVQKDLEEAEKWTNIKKGKVDISELTWEQKESVLRLLFAKMNGLSHRKYSKALVPLTPASYNFAETTKTGTDETTPTLTFITQQAPVSEPPCSKTVFPDIHIIPPQPD